MTERYKHSVKIAGKTTSVFVSAETWDRLNEIAAARNLSRPQLIRIIDAGRREEGRDNLSEVLTKYALIRGARKEVAARLAGENAA